MALYSNYEYTIRQRLSRMLDDCVLATVSAGDTTTATIATTNPPHFYNKGDDSFNDKYEVYCYSGTNVGVSRVVTDWASHVLTVAPAAGSDYATDSLLELHRMFVVTELRDAINQAIDFYAKKYLIDLKDETTVVLVEGEDNLGNTLYTYEYSLPTNLLYIHRVTTEGAVSGIKLTGTISGNFTLGETITGKTSGATGKLSRGVSGGTYILVREVDGDFEVGEIAEGGTSGETCSAITAVDYETVGDGKFEEEDVVDPRDWKILRAYAPKIKFDEEQYWVVGDLRIRLEGQGSQANITADTDNIFLPPHELVEVAATFLPFSKIESNNLTAVFNKCLRTRERVEARPPIHPYANSKRVIE
jgi:hypothetical protein